MTPGQMRLLAESCRKLDDRLPELGEAVYTKLIEISPETRALFKGDMQKQYVKLGKTLAEFARVKTRSQHFLPVTGKGGEAVIPGVSALGIRHETEYGVRPEHYDFMREALLHALARLLGKDFNEEIAVAWGETFDMIAEAMQKHAGGTRETEAFARLFSGKPAGLADGERRAWFFDFEEDAGA
jgi:hemoglobin-like flavoprotein